MAALWMLAVGLPFAGSLRAQSAETAPVEAVPAWSKVRIRAPLVSSRWVQGQLVRADSDSVVLERGRKGSLVVPRWQVERLQVASGSNHVAGAARGLLIGSVVLSVPLVLIAQHQSGPHDDSAGLTAFVTTTLGAAVGLLTGAIVGVQEWRKVPLPPLPSPAPQPSPADTTGRLQDPPGAVAGTADAGRACGSPRGS